MGHKPGTEDMLAELYISNIGDIGGGFPPYINTARREYLETFTLLGLPGRDHEGYRHTGLHSVFQGLAGFSFVPGEKVETSSVCVECEGYRINMSNGFCDDPGSLVQTEQGIIYGSLKQAADTCPDIVQNYYNSLADNSNEALTALNSVFMQDGAFIYLPEEVKAQWPFILDLKFGSGNGKQLAFQRILLIAEKGSSADVVISYSQDRDSRFVVDSVRETFTGVDAALNISETVDISPDSFIVTGNYLRQDENSRTDMLNIWMGGNIRVNNITDLSGVHCDSKLYGLFLANGEENKDITMTVNHMVPSCESYELVKGIASGGSRGAFTGKVYVAEDAQKTLAYQQNRNLQIGDNARIYAEPQLEIYADDVKCSHGATVGMLDDEAVYYMRQRGISEEDARRLQLFGFVNDIVSHCPVGAVCSRIEEIATAKIEKL